MVFHNGEQALNNLNPIMAVSAILPDFIVLDLNMPLMDGWEFLDEFVKIPSKKRSPFIWSPLPLIGGCNKGKIL